MRYKSGNCFCKITSVILNSTFREEGLIEIWQEYTSPVIGVHNVRLLCGYADVFLGHELVYYHEIL